MKILKVNSKEEILKALINMRIYVLQKHPDYTKKIQRFIDLGEE